MIQRILRIGCVMGMLGLAACQFKLDPTFPALRVAQDLRKMCLNDYKMTIQARSQGTSLQSFFWTVGMMQPADGEMRPEAAESLQRVLLCATRIVLSTDATVEFVEIKMADVLTGDTIKVWRYVPDIQDSMHTRIGEEEYFNRLVLEVEPGTTAHSEGHEIVWDEPMSLPEFLAKQIILRAKRQSPGLQAHEDLSNPATLTVVIENWPAIVRQGDQQKASVTDAVDKIARDVLKGYRYKGFQGIDLQDSHGLALGHLAL
jgi:hypothetical protein